MKKQDKPKKKKVKVVYREDTGETIYPMSGLYGRDPIKEAKEGEKAKEQQPIVTEKKERSAMIRAAFTVYTPVLLCAAGAFLLTALLLNFFLRG